MRRFLLTVLLLISALAAQAHAEARLALVIGNAAYKHTSKLDNAANDARLVASTLKRQGFDVTEQIDADLKQMKRALGAFFAKVQRAGKDAVVVVYLPGTACRCEG